MDEIFVPIKGYEGLYEVSNLGRVKSFKMYKDGKLLKLTIMKIGYLRVTLCKNDVQKPFYVHRLVALHFVENPNPKEFNVINHKDENKLNNVYTNLEWCTQTYNQHYGTARQKQAEKLRGVLNTKKSKPVEAYNDDGKIIYTFPSLMEAHRHGFDFRLVSAVCRGKRYYHKGLHWRYASA